MYGNPWLSAINQMTRLSTTRATPKSLNFLSQSAMRKRARRSPSWGKRRMRRGFKRR